MIQSQIKRSLRATLSLAVLLGSLLALNSACATAAPPVVGQKAPDFTLSTPEGNPIHLAKLVSKGNVVLIVLRGYPGYQCPFCTKQVHDFLENANKFHAEVLLVYPGPPAEISQRAQEFLVKQSSLPANFHLVIDPDYAFTNLYNLRWDAPHETAYPSTFLIDRNNTIFFARISHAHGDRTSAADMLAELAKAR